MLQLDKLRLCRTQGKRNNIILNNLQQQFQPSSITVIIGQSGSGKSSLLRCMAQLERAYSGTITIDDQCLRSMPAKQRAKQLGLVPQSYALFQHMTVLQNIVHPLILAGYDAEVAYLRAASCLQQVELSEKTLCLPHQLSGGQRQRAAIARYLALQPRFLLLDEPTSALDSANVAILGALLLELRDQGVGCIVATHDLHFAKHIADQILTLDGGVLG